MHWCMFFFLILYFYLRFLVIFIPIASLTPPTRSSRGFICVLTKLSIPELGRAEFGGSPIFTATWKFLCSSMEAIETRNDRGGSTLPLPEVRQDLFSQVQSDEAPETRVRCRSSVSVRRVQKTLQAPSSPSRPRENPFLSDRSAIWPRTGRRVSETLATERRAERRLRLIYRSSVSSIGEYTVIYTRLPT